MEKILIAVDDGMPQHGHGLPTALQMTAYLGNGKNRTDGVRFNMRGWQKFKLDISAIETADTITFNLVF